MTDSRCWIDLRDDEALSDQLRASPECSIDPARVEMGYRYLWINDLRQWAASKGLPIEYPDMGWIVEQVTVNKHLLLKFLEEMLGPENSGSSGGTINTVQSMVREYGSEDGRYRILADDY